MSGTNCPSRTPVDFAARDLKQLKSSSRGAASSPFLTLLEDWRCALRCCGCVALRRRCPPPCAPRACASLPAPCPSSSLSRTRPARPAPPGSPLHFAFGSHGSPATAAPRRPRRHGHRPCPPPPIIPLFSSSISAPRAPAVADARWRADAKPTGVRVQALGAGCTVITRGSARIYPRCRWYSRCTNYQQLHATLSEWTPSTLPVPRGFTSLPKCSFRTQGQGAPPYSTLHFWVNHFWVDETMLCQL